MEVILNNNTQNTIPIDDYVYDYLTLTAHFVSRDRTQWTNDLLNYLLSIKDVVITTITLKHNGQILRNYTNLTGHFVNMSEIFVINGSDINADLTMDIELPNGIQNT